jgi:hypothetical protein
VKCDSLFTTVTVTKSKHHTKLEHTSSPEFCKSSASRLTSRLAATVLQAGSPHDELQEFCKPAHLTTSWVPTRVCEYARLMSCCGPIDGRASNPSFPLEEDEEVNARAAAPPSLPLPPDARPLPKPPRPPLAVGKSPDGDERSSPPPLPLPRFPAAPLQLGVRARQVKRQRKSTKHGCAQRREFQLVLAAYASLCV